MVGSSTAFYAAHAFRVTRIFLYSRVHSTGETNMGARGEGWVVGQFVIGAGILAATAERVAMGPISRTTGHEPAAKEIAGEPTSNVGRLHGSPESGQVAVVIAV